MREPHRLEGFLVVIVASCSARFRLLSAARPVGRPAFVNGPTAPCGDGLRSVLRRTKD
jgi:hypothetical protein